MIFALPSCDKSQPRTGIVTFYGTITDKNGEPVNGVQIKIGGSDTPGGSAVTGSDGAYELPISIIPNKRGKELVFVIAATKIDYNNYYFGDFGVDYRYFTYVGGNAGDRIAYAAKISTGWDALGTQVHHSFNVNIGGFR